MAIYHFTVKAISRSNGHTAIASAAYRRATLMKDECNGKVQDYRRKNDVIHSEMSLPPNAPDWVNALVTVENCNVHAGSERFWNAVEQHEKRADAQLAREIEFSLPIELSPDQAITLAREFIRDQFALRGMVADWSVHWDKGNPHVHVMLSMRELLSEGFGLKVRDWNHASLVVEWRTKWAEYANFHLKLHQHDVCIDHRSYKEQGIDLVPTQHQGRAVSEMTRKGVPTYVMDEANSIRRENLNRIAQDASPLFKKMCAESPTFELEKMGQELGRYLNDQGQFSISDSRFLAHTLLRETAATESPSLTNETIAKLLMGIENHDSVFSERDLAKAVSAYTDNAELFAQAVLQIKNSSEIVALGVGDDGRERFTTRRMLALENRLQIYVDSLRARPLKELRAAKVERTLLDYQQQTGKVLTQEQKAAVTHILKNDAISCLVGRAGTGKSFSLGAARAVWEAQGLVVHGVALSGIAADGLRKDASIDSRTIESFRYALINETLALNSRSMVVMDEAGMTDTPAMLAVVEAVEKAQAKLVLVGDHAQLQPVGPGASFRAIVERLGFAEIHTIYRQRKEWQRQATAQFAAGKVADALQAYAENDCVHFKENDREAMQQLVKHWLHLHEERPTLLHEQLVIAYQNKDVASLNTLLRAARVQRGDISEGYNVTCSAGRMRIAQGDRLLFLKNNRLLGVSNGRFASVISVKFTESGQVINFQAQLDGSDAIVTIDPSNYNSFTHGYAATVHKTQGVTVDHALTYIGAAGWNRHTAYVAHTRHRQSCHVYASQSNYSTLDKLKDSLSRHGLKDSVLDFPLAFAERRSIDAQGLLSGLPAHLAQRLSAIKNQITESYTRFTDPDAYWQKKQTSIDEQLRADSLLATREDARLVAQYVDHSRNVGQAYQAFARKIRHVGFRENKL